MLFKELRYIFIDNNFTILRVIKMIINKAIFTNEGLVFTTEFWGYLMRVRIAKDQRKRDSFSYLFNKMLICTYLDRFIIIDLCTVIRVTERTIELTFNDEFLALTFDHDSLHALSASNFFTTLQLYWLSVLKIERKFAELTFKDLQLERRHKFI